MSSIFIHFPFQRFHLMCNRCILFIRTVNVFIFFDHILPLTFHMIHGGGTIYFLHIPLDVMNMIIFFAQFLPLLSSFLAMVQWCRKGSSSSYALLLLQLLLCFSFLLCFFLFGGGGWFCQSRSEREREKEKKAHSFHAIHSFFFFDPLHHFLILD